MEQRCRARRWCCQICPGSRELPTTLGSCGSCPAPGWGGGAGPWPGPGGGAGLAGGWGLIPIPCLPHPHQQLWNRSCSVRSCRQGQGPPRRGGFRGLALSPPALPCPPVLRAGAESSCPAPGSSSPCPNTRGLGKYLPLLLPGRIIAHDRNTAGAAAAPPPAPVPVAARGARGARGGGSCPPGRVDAPGWPRCPWWGCGGSRGGGSAQPLPARLTALPWTLPRSPAATAQGQAPSPTPTLLPPPTTSEGRAATEGGCRGDRAAPAPGPRCRWAPRPGGRSRPVLEQRGSRA